MRRALLVCAVLCIASQRTLVAQGTSGDVGLFTTPKIAIGYVANAPEELAGGALLVIPPGLNGWGFYLDVKGTLGSPTKKAGFIPDMTSEMVEDEATDELVGWQVNWRSFNAALVRTVAPEFAIYAGAGFGRSKGYREYVDFEEERGVGGYYWVTHHPDDGERVNLLAGAFIGIDRFLVLQLGVETAPRGFTIGASLPLPIF